MNYHVTEEAFQQIRYQMSLDFICLSVSIETYEESVCGVTKL